MRRGTPASCLLAILALAALGAAFHYAMERDADRLCSSDATAYEGCADR